VYIGFQSKKVYGAILKTKGKRAGGMVQVVELDKPKAQSSNFYTAKKKKSGGRVPHTQNNIENYHSIDQSPNS
jgi:hypothetical protein